MSWVENDELWVANQLGCYEERLRQLERLVRSKENARVIYTEDVCRILGIEPPSLPKDTETGDQ